MTELVVPRVTDAQQGFLPSYKKKCNEEIEWFTRGSLLMATYVNLIRIGSDLQPFTKLLGCKII